MASDTLTLKLEGDVTLADFAKAIVRFNSLVNALSQEVAKDAQIDWVVDDLQGGSASTTTLGTAASMDPLTRVRSAYLAVGTALDLRQIVPYSAKVAEAASGLQGIMNGRIHDIVFETSVSEVVVRSHPLPTVRRRPAIEARGAITGRVQTLSSRGGLRFTLYDLLYDRAISCYLAEGEEAQMRDAWGRLAIVRGVVRRDPETGRPTSIRQIDHVDVRADPDPDAYQLARGAVPLPPGAEMPEDTIRRMRDA